jgi:hypothetical protein
MSGYHNHSSGTNKLRKTLDKTNNNTEFYTLTRTLDTLSPVVELLEEKSLPIKGAIKIAVLLFLLHMTL